MLSLAHGLFEQVAVGDMITALVALRRATQGVPVDLSQRMVGQTLADADREFLLVLAAAALAPSRSRAAAPGTAEPPAT